MFRKLLKSLLVIDIDDLRFYQNSCLKYLKTAKIRNSFYELYINYKNEIIYRKLNKINKSKLGISSKLGLFMMPITLSIYFGLILIGIILINQYIDILIISTLSLMLVICSIYLIFTKLVQFYEYNKLKDNEYIPDYDKLISDIN